MFGLNLETGVFGLYNLEKRMFGLYNLETGCLDYII